MNEQETLSLIQQWLDGSFSPEPHPADALGAGPANPPLVSSAILVGSRAEEGLKNAKVIKSAPTTDAQFEAFKNDYATACSTILDISRAGAKFNPTNPTDPKAKEKYLDYLNRVQKAPFFTLMEASREVIKSESKNYDQLIDSVADTFQGLVEKNKKAIVQGLANLAKVAANTESTKQTKDLFLQSVLSADEVYSVYLYTCHVDMESATKKGIKEQQSLFEVSTTRLQFKPPVWALGARKVFDKTVKTVDDWLDDNTTEAEGDSFKLCLTEPA
jgi:hypothetical protein